MLIESNRNVKIFAAIGIIAAVFLIVILAVVVMNKSAIPQNPETKIQNSTAGKQKEMLEAIKKANGAEVESQLSDNEKEKKQEEMARAIEAANKNTNPVSAEEQINRQQEMLKAINNANKK